MDDIDDFRNRIGLAADLSCWSGINLEERYMKIKTREKTDNQEEQVIYEEKRVEPQMAVPYARETEQKMETPDKYNKPGEFQKEIEVDLEELRETAIKLLPTADKISKDDFVVVCDKAIEMAYIFQKVFEQKIEV